MIPDDEIDLLLCFLEYIGVHHHLEDEDQYSGECLYRMMLQHAKILRIDRSPYPFLLQGYALLYGRDTSIESTILANIEKACSAFDLILYLLRQCVILQVILDGRFSHGRLCNTFSLVCVSRDECGAKS